MSDPSADNSLLENNSLLEEFCSFFWSPSLTDIKHAAERVGLETMLEYMRRLRVTSAQILEIAQYTQYCIFYRASEESYTNQNH